MIKRLLARFRRHRGTLKARVDIAFSQDDQVAAAVSWFDGGDREEDTIALAVYFYARILYELAELHEPRVAQELMAFLGQVVDKMLAPPGPPLRPRLPLGELRLTDHPLPESYKAYTADFIRFQDGHFALEFKGSIGKEGFYLPAAFLVFFQNCLERLDDQHLLRMTKTLGRLHSYYRYRRDFWDGTALTAGPAFALSSEELRGKETPTEA
ncbi:MAG: hypothetical protein FJ128_10205 [Deltaproteobacteria bacterium]|nr:hypothetical protein [Deltaproteobacteria bacterium]